MAVDWRIAFAQACRELNEQYGRVAELEAEVERLKAKNILAMNRVWKLEAALRAVSSLCKH
jgi:hypothetical protein